MTAVLVSKENDKAVFTEEVSPEEFEQAVQNVYNKVKGRFAIPGFRKGKAPRKIIEANYGKGVFYEDALNDLLPSVIERAVAALELEPIGTPDVDVKEMEEGKPIVFEITTDLMPHPTLGDYKSIEVLKKDDSVSDEEVDAVVEQEQKKNGVQTPVEDRAAQDGDTATIDFEGFLGDEAFEGGRGEDYELVLGSGTFIPGFEEQVVGHKPGESFDVNVTFPEEYGAEDLAGKDVTFKVTLHELNVMELPELDDEFAKDVSEFDTLDEYKNSIREKLQADRQKSQRAQSENEAIERLIRISEVNVPHSMVDDQVENEVRDMANQLSQMGMTMDQYLEYSGGNLDALRMQMHPQAERRVAGDLVLKSLIEAESIDATKEEVDEEIRSLAEQYGAKDVEDFAKKVYEYGNEGMVKEDLLKKKAIDKLMEYVTYVDKIEGEEEEHDHDHGHDHNHDHGHDHDHDHDHE